MKRIKQLALCGVVMTLGASGLAYAQTASPPAPPAASVPADVDDDGPMLDEAVPGDEMQGDAMAGDDDDDAADVDVRPMPAPGGLGDDGRGGKGPMGWMDKNKDGTIDKAEFQAGKLERLKAADTNGDGTLSEDELETMVLKQMAERRAARMMKRLDIDGDGKVTLAESEGMRDKRFAVLDLDNDGKIDERELREAHRGVGPSHPGGPRMHGPRHGGPHHEGPRDHGPRHHGDRHDGGMEWRHHHGRLTHGPQDE
jgi:hypothetical protein